MNALPLVLRELYVAGHSQAMFRWRMAFGAGGMGLSVWSFLVWGNAHGNGHWVYTMLLIITAVVVMASSWLMAADKVSRERREGTLGFLFLTDLLPADVVLGKFAATTLLPGIALLAIFPGLALCQLMGGVPHPEFARGMLSLLLTLGFSISTTLFVSSLCVDHRKAHVSAAVLLTLCNPLWLCFASFRNIYNAKPFLFWIGALFFLALTVILLGASAFRMTAYWQDIDGPDEHAKRSERLVAATKAGADPVAWMMSRRRVDARGQRITIELIALVFAGAMALLPNAVLCLLIVFLAHSVFQALVLLRTAYAFYTDRQDGSLELLLGSPLETTHIFEGFSKFLRNRSRPMLVTFTVCDVVCAFFLALTTPVGLGLAALPLAMAATLWVSVFGFGWLGVYRSLLSNHPAIAMLHAFVRLSFFPMILSFLFLFAPGTDVAKVSIFWVMATGFTALFFGVDAQAALKRYGRELLLRPFSEKIPEIENEWSFINWEEETQGEARSSQIPFDLLAAR